MDIKTKWGFVERYYPDYSTSHAIAYADDLQKIVDGEINGDAKKMYDEITEDLKGMFPYHSPEEREEYRMAIETDAQNRLNEALVDIYERSIESFINEPQQTELNDKAVLLFNLLQGAELINTDLQEQVDSALKELEKLLDFRIVEK